MSFYTQEVALSFLSLAPSAQPQEHDMNVPAGHHSGNPLPLLRLLLPLGRGLQRRLRPLPLLLQLPRPPSPSPPIPTTPQLTGARGRLELEELLA